MSQAVSPDTATERVVKAFEALPELAASDPDIARRGRFLTCDFEIGVGDVPLSISIIDGRVTSARRGPFLLKPHAFSIWATAEAWQSFHRSMPAPGDHDILALNKTGRARISGNLVPLMGNLQVVKDLLALPRRLSRMDG